MSLSALLKKGPLRAGATAIPATAATDERLNPSTVARVATVAVATAQESAANEPAHRWVEMDAPASADPDRWCWPKSAAMNTAEIEAFTVRTMLFIRRGICPTQADDLAESLTLRDRNGDDRRLCLECAHLSGRGPGEWRCRSARAAGVLAELPGDLVTQCQRCRIFQEVTP